MEGYDVITSEQSKVGHVVGQSGDFAIVENGLIRHSRHVVPLVLKTSTHTLLVPVQWSAASLSQPPACELPVQLAADDANESFGHVALAPVHFSATSHWPAEARQTKLADLKASTHVLAVPEQ